MDTETKEKLTEQQHQIDLLRKDVEAGMKVMESQSKEAIAKNESAIDRLLAGNERFRTDIKEAIGNLRTDFGDLRTDMEKNVNSITIRMIGIVALGVAILAFILK